MKHTFTTLLTYLIIITLLGCGSSGTGGGGDEGSDASSGTLTIKVTDAPVDTASSVVVEFTGLSIQPESGDRLDFDFNPDNAPKKIDLLSLSGSDTETLLDGKTVPSGHYSWVRLKVNAECNTMDSYVGVTGDSDSPYPLWIPSGNTSGLKLVNGFNVPSGGSADLTIDFDLRKSVLAPRGQGNCSGNYKLKPTLRMVDNSSVGFISGSVSGSLLQDDSCAGGFMVYIFEGHDIIPDDIDDLGPDPLTTAFVRFDSNSGTYRYRAAFLSPGNYTAAFTCQAHRDDPETDESVSATPIAFIGTSNSSVTAGNETTINF